MGSGSCGCIITCSVANAVMPEKKGVEEQNRAKTRTKTVAVGRQM
jgi:hypothetical protein